MNNAVSVFPVLMSAFPPDMLDEYGVPLMEGTSMRFPDRRRGPGDYVACPYEGTRSGAPMNIGALRAIQRNKAVQEAYLGGIGEQ